MSKNSGKENVGVYFGLNAISPVVTRLRKPRSESNVLILATSGVGKGFSTMKTILSERG